MRSTSPRASASATADLVIEPIQPWSAAGAEKPMRIFSPEAVPPAAPDELAAAAAVVVPAALELAADVVPELDEELVQAVRARAPAAITASERRTGRRGVVRRDVDD